MYVAQLAAPAFRLNATPLRYFFNTKWNYTMCIEQKQMQGDKLFFLQHRQGKSVSVIEVVVPKETSKGFPASSSHPCLVRSSPDLHCTRSGCSLFLRVGLQGAAMSSGQYHPVGRKTSSRGLCRAQLPYRHMSISCLGSWTRLCDGMSKGFWDSLEWIMVCNT